MSGDDERGIGRIGIVLLGLVICMVLLIIALILSGWQVNTVLSGSMEPAIPVGGIVFVRPAAADDIGVGDVITYQSGGYLVTHRVVGVDDGPSLAFRTMGDANEDPDPSAVAATAVVGTVAFSLPFVGYLVTFLRSPAGLIVIGLLLLVFIFLEYASLARKNDPEEKGPEK